MLTLMIGMVISLVSPVHEVRQLDYDAVVAANCTVTDGGDSHELAVRFARPFLALDASFDGTFMATAAPGERVRLHQRARRTRKTWLRAYGDTISFASAAQIRCTIYQPIGTSELEERTVVVPAGRRVELSGFDSNQRTVKVWLQRDEN